MVQGSPKARFKAAVDAHRPPISLSNRRGIGSIIEPRPGQSVGVDKLSASFPVTGFEPDLASWTSLTQSETRDGVVTTRYGATVELRPGVSVFVGVLDRSDARSKAIGKIELNPSRFVDPDGCSLAPVGAVLPAVVEALGCLVDEFVELPASYRPEDLLVRRLDVARDFHDVSSPSSTIRALGPINRPWARRNATYSDPKAHGAQTLLVGSGAGSVRAYDKSVETKGLAAAGTVRFEAQCRKDWCVRYGQVVTLGDVSEDSVNALGFNRWEWSAMGVEVGSNGRVVDVVAKSGLSALQQATFIGWLVTQATPHAYVPAKETAAKFRRLQRELGIAVGPDSIDAPSFVSRLDWESGEEVLRVA